MLEVIRTSSQSWWVRGIFILLIAIFILWGIGSAFLPNPTVIATVDGYVITQEQFLRRLQQEKNTIIQENPDITDNMLEEMGIRKQVLNSLIIRHLLLTQAQNIGLFVSNDALRKAIMDLPLFKNQEGKFDISAYNSIAKDNKSGILLFEEELRNDLLIQKLATLIQNSAFISEKTAQQMYAFLNEERSIEYSIIPASQYLDIVEITDEEKETFYNTNKATWEEPHRMHIEYIPITTQSIIASLKIPSSTITNYYELHREQYKNMSQQEARKAIAQLLKEQQVPQLKEDLIDKIQALLTEGKSFQAVAQSINIPIEQVATRPLDEIEEIIDIPAGTLTKYNSVANNTTIIDPIPLINKSGIVFIHIRENTPKNTPSLQEIEGEVEYALRMEKAIAKAKETAKQIQQKGQLPATHTKSTLFPRFNPPLELPVRSDAFIQDLFTTPKGSFLKDVYTTTQGAFVARVDDIFASPQIEWEQAKKSFIRQIQRVQGDLLLRAFQNYLYTKSKITLVNTNILEPTKTTE